MSRVHLFLVVLVSSLAAGCAGNRDNVADDSAAAAAPAATLEAAPAGGGAAPAVVDGNQLAARAAQTPICRDVLRRGSNVYVTECRTAEQWRIYQRAEAQAAGELVRRMQRGGPPDDPFTGGGMRRR